MTENKFINECGCSCNEGHSHGRDGEECGCGHNHDHEEQTMHLVLDDGSEVKCFVLGIFDVSEQEYIALVPEGEEIVYLYKYDEANDGPVLSNIQDDEEFEAVSEVFREIYE